MTDVEAEDLWTTIYKGKLVRFCCNNCVESFRREPEKYVANLPQFSNLTDASNANETSAESPGFNPQWLARIAVMFGSGLFCYFGIGWLQNRMQLAVGKGAFLIPMVTAIVVAMLATFSLKLYQVNQHLAIEVVKEKAKSEIHLATYYDYGVPPVPDNPQVEPTLSRSFYRGNDERSPVLFNGGNYQTAQFDIEIQHANGQPVQVGDSLTNETLYLFYRIYKPENAPKRMYDRKLMSRMFLTRSHDPAMGWEQPIADKKPLDIEMEDEIWSCRFPLDVSRVNQIVRFDPQSVTRDKLAKIPGVGSQVADWFVSYRDAGYPITGKEDLRQAGITGEAANAISASLDGASHQGLIYVCEAFLYKGRQLGARFHYGIKYDLRIRDGRIAEGSQVWMGALSRSLKAKKGAVPDNQWLNTKPLPELPAAQNVSDKLLGIDDYDF